MIIPDASSNVWKDVLLKGDEYNFEFLALKILLGRLKIAIKSDNNNATFQKSAEELREFFIKTGNIPKSKNDLVKILNKGGFK